MKSYTDINQSKKLAEFLLLESADFVWLIGHLHTDGPRYEMIRAKGEVSEPENYWPCWSLAALLKILNETSFFIDEDASVNLYSYKTVEWYLGINNSNLELVTESNPIDACVDMIMKLHEQNLI